MLIILEIVFVIFAAVIGFAWKRAMGMMGSAGYRRHRGRRRGIGTRRRKRGW